MSTEVQMLIAASVLGILQILLAAQAATLVRGVKWNMGSRDGKMAELSGVPGRLDRASKNFLETFPFFAVAVLIVQVTGRHTEVSAWGAQLYILARLIYLPLYASGIAVVRTLVWGLSFTGLAMVLWTAAMG